MKKRLFGPVCLLLCFAMLLAGCGAVGGGDDDTRVVLTLNDFEVIADTYRYYYLSYGMEQAEQRDWNVNLSHIDGNLRSLTETALCDLYAIYSLAQELGITLSDSRKEQMDADMASLFAQVGGEDAYYEQCERYYMTGDLFRMLYLESVYLKEELYGHLKNNQFPGDRETVLSDIRENFYHVSQICVFFEDMDYEDARTFINEKKADLDAGGHTFGELSYDFGEGVYYTLGYAPIAFENASLALQEGEVSEIVESDVGFHIIKRLPMEDTQIEAQYEDLREMYFQRLFTECLAESAGSLRLARAKKYDAVLADLGEELTALIAAAKAEKETK